MFKSVMNLKQQYSEFAGHMTNHKIAIIFCVLLFLTCSFLSYLIPPGQSPDEYAHIARAISLFSAEPHKQLMTTTDNSALVYLKKYTLPPGEETQLTKPMIEAAKEVKRSNTESWIHVDGAIFYFPALYFPYALGLKIGEICDISPHYTYYLARLLGLLFIVGILFAAFTIYPPNPAMMALLMMPMLLYQFASPVIDGPYLATLILGLSCFLRICRDNGVNTSKWFYLMLIAITLSAMAKVIVLPFVLLFFIATYYYGHAHKIKMYLYSVICASTAIWWIYSIAMVGEYRVININATPSFMAIFEYYIFYHPMQFLHLITTTVGHHYKELSKCAIGVLGWLDAPLNSTFYRLFICISILIGMISFNHSVLKGNRIIVTTFISTSVISLMIMFLSLLALTPPYSTEILGLQGRYFYTFLIPLCYVFSSSFTHLTPARQRAIFLSLALLYSYTLFSTTQTLLDRYYLYDPLANGSKQQNSTCYGGWK
jgi:uncharacterized membrane protein